MNSSVFLNDNFGKYHTFHQRIKNKKVKEYRGMGEVEQEQVEIFFFSSFLSGLFPRYKYILCSDTLGALGVAVL